MIAFEFASITGTQNLGSAIDKDVLLIYNIPTDQWVHDFVVSGPLPTTATANTKATASTAPTSVPTTDNPTPPTTSKSSSNMAGPIGGAVGGVIVVAALGFFFYRRHKRKANNDPSPPALNNAGDENYGYFNRKRGLFGQGNRDDDNGDDHNHRHHVDNDTIQLQETGFVKGGGAINASYPSSSSSTPFMQESLPTPLQPRLSDRPVLPTGNPFIGYRNNPHDSTISLGMADSSSRPVSPVTTITARNMVTTASFTAAPGSKPGVITTTPQFGAISTAATTSPAPLPMSHFGSVLPPPPSSSTLPQSASAPLSPAALFPQGFSPTDSSRQFSYYDKDGLAMSGPSTVPMNAVYSNSPQCIPVGSDGQIWSMGDMSGRVEPRSPQFFGQSHETSPASWMAMMNNNSSNPQLLDPSGVYNRGSMIGMGMGGDPMNGRGSFYSPLQGQVVVGTADNSDLMQKKLKLMKAQHELTLERIKLEQESEMQFMERQLRQ